MTRLEYQTNESRFCCLFVCLLFRSENFGSCACRNRLTSLRDYANWARTSSARSFLPDGKLLKSSSSRITLVLQKISVIVTRIRNRFWVYREDNRLLVSQRPYECATSFYISRSCRASGIGYPRIESVTVNSYTYRVSQIVRQLKT